MNALLFKTEHNGAIKVSNSILDENALSPNSVTFGNTIFLTNLELKKWILFAKA